MFDYYQPEAVKARRRKIQDEIILVARETRPGYREPGVFGSIIEAIKESAISMASGLGATTEMIGNITNSILLTDIGQKMQLKAEKTLASNPEWREEEGARWGAKKVARLVAGALPSLLGIIGATLIGSIAGPIGSFTAGTAFAFSLEAGSPYREAIRAGKSEEEARKFGFAVGSVNAVLERIFPSRLLDKKKIAKDITEKLSKSLVKDLLKKLRRFGVKFTKNGTLEGSTEALQELWANLIATNYDENRNLWDNLLESFVGGFGAGGIAGVALEQGKYTPQEVMDQVIDSPIQDTPEGKILIKSALEAQKQGRDIVIEDPKVVEPKEVEKPKVPEEKKVVEPISKELEPLIKEEVNRKISEAVRPLVKKFGLSDYSVSDYAGFKAGISADNKTGYAIKPDGELISVFNTGIKGNGRYAVEDAIENGANRLDVFDGGLVQYYKRFGFREVKRL